MAIPKVCGIETEYGVVLRNAPDSNPVLASSLLINAYVEHRRIGWDFDDETPGRDARGFGREGSQPPEVETHLVNTVLTNGARYYVDHAHPEYSTPECADALELVVADKAGERTSEVGEHQRGERPEAGEERGGGIAHDHEEREHARDDDAGARGRAQVDPVGIPEMAAEAPHRRIVPTRRWTSVGPGRK